MSKSKKKASCKKKEVKKVLCCPDCGCSDLVGTSTKIHRFPKTHLFKFECGFAYLYNSKKEQIYLDVDWQCRRRKTANLRLTADKKFCKEYAELSKKTLNKSKNKED